MTRYALIAMLCAFTALADAPVPGNESGKGGNGVWIGGKPYLLDLVEFGIQDQPLVDRSLTKHPTFGLVRTTIAKPLQKVLSGAEIDQVATKILEVGQYFPGRAVQLMLGIPKFLWLPITQELKGVWPADTTLDPQHGQRVTLAIRHQGVVRVKRETLGQLDSANRVALVLHEIWSAIDGNGEESARRAVGYVFSSDFVEDKGERLALLDGLTAIDRAPVRYLPTWGLFAYGWGSLMNVTVHDYWSMQYGAILVWTDQSRSSGYLQMPTGTQLAKHCRDGQSARKMSLWVPSADFLWKDDNSNLTPVQTLYAYATAELQPGESCEALAERLAQKARQEVGELREVFGPMR